MIKYEVFVPRASKAAALRLMGVLHAGGYPAAMREIDDYEDVLGPTVFEMIAERFVLTLANIALFLALAIVAFES